jgi:hypothetical protein
MHIISWWSQPVDATRYFEPGMKRGFGHEFIEEFYCCGENGIMRSLGSHLSKFGTLDCHVAWQLALDGEPENVPQWRLRLLVVTQIRTYRQHFEMVAVGVKQRIMLQADHHSQYFDAWFNPSCERIR